MATKPVVRYMLLCDDWRLHPPNNRRITIIGLISNIYSLEDPPYPLYYQEMCAFLALTEGRGRGEVVGVPFRIRDCTFPKAGLYAVQFWFGDELIEQRPIRMR